MHISKYDEIFFIEGSIKDANIIDKISVELDGFFLQSQLKTLDDVKNKMAFKAKELGANAIINFKYGQKSSFWKSLVSLDDVRWYGSGVIATISENEINKFISK